MKKIILSAFLLFSNIAFAQENVLNSVNPAESTTSKDVNANKASMIKATSSENKNTRYDTQIKLYKEGELINSFIMSGVLNHSEYMSSNKITSYVSEITKDSDTKEVTKKINKLKSGVDIEYIIRHFDEKTNSVLISNFIELNDLVSLQRMYDIDKTDYIELPETTIKMIRQTNLVKLNQEFLLSNWKEYQIKLLVTKVN